MVAWQKKAKLLYGKITDKEPKIIIGEVGTLIPYGNEYLRILGTDKTLRMYYAKEQEKFLRQVLNFANQQKWSWNYFDFYDDIHKNYDQCHLLYYIKNGFYGRKF